MTQVQQFEMEQGADWSQEILYNKPDGTPEDLTGYTAKMALATSPGEAPVLELTETAGITLGGALGTVKLAITGAQSKALVFPPRGRFYYDLMLFASSVSLKLLKGEFIVSPLVTFE